MAAPDREMDLMIDFETLGVSEDAVVLTVGMATFDHEGIASNIYMEFGIQTQIFDGRTIDPSTLAWWRNQDDVELHRMICNPINPMLPMAVEHKLKDWEFNKIWSRGCMDFHILNSLCENPFPFYLHRDVRTLDVFGLKMDSNNHNAMDDVCNQIDYVNEVFSEFHRKD